MEISRVITVIVMFKTLLKSGMGSDFCDSFTKNQYRIHYVLSLDLQHFFIFIDYDYWQISYHSGVQLVSTESADSYLFGKQHNMTFAGYSKEANKSVIGVFNSFENRIYWRLYSSEKFEKLKDSTLIKFNDNFEPNIGFRVNDSELIGFVQQTNQSKEFRYFSFDEIMRTNEPKSVDKFDGELTKLEDIEVEESLKMIGIHFTNEEELGYLILFVSYNNIHYCFTAKGCQNHDLNLMVECGKPCHLTNVFIVGIIILSFLGISSIVINIIICYQFPKSDEEITESKRFSTKTEFNAGTNFLSSIQTVDEVTGEPLKPKATQKK